MDNGWWFSIGLISGILFTAILFAGRNLPIYIRWRLRNLLIRLKRRGRHRRESYKITHCPICKAIVHRKGYPTKADHFRQVHPEYKFKVDYPYVNSWQPNTPRYTCLVCNKTFGSFNLLIEKHHHREDT